MNRTTDSARWIASFSIAACLGIGGTLSAQPERGRTPVSPKPPIPVVSSLLGHSVNVDALVSPNTFVVMPNQTRELPVLITMPPLPTFNGSVTLTVTCCTDPSTGKFINLGNSVTVSIAPFQLPVAPLQSSTATLTVNTFDPPTVAFLATIHVDNAAWKFHATGSILVSAVKVPGDDTLCSNSMTPGSGTAAEVLPLSDVTTGRFMAKEATPAQTMFDIGALTKDHLHGWHLTIDSGGALAPTASTIVFKNSTQLEKRIVPFDTSSCMPSQPGANLIVGSGQSMTIPIFSPQTTTLVLQRRVCRASFGFCFSWGYDDVAVFSAPPFWTLFGGRRVTIEWISSSADQ